MPQRRTLSFILVLALLSPEAFAQTGDWQYVRALSSGDAIIVTTSGGKRYHGALVGATDDSVSLNADERAFPGRRRSLRRVPKADVREVRRYKPAASTLASTGIGAAAGVALGAGAEASSRSNEDRGLALGVLTFFGGLIGFGIGLHTTLIKGERVYTQ